MSQSQALPIGRQRPQQNIFITASSSIGTLLPIPLSVTAVFPVKEINFHTGYSIDSTGSDLYYLTADMPIPDMSVVACCSKLANITAGSYTYSDSPTTVNYILREPTVLAGSHVISIKKLVGTSANASYDFLIRVELLG